MSRQGFTLIEMILSLVILSVVATTLYTVFANGLMIQRRSQSVEHVSRELYWALSQITQDIENAVFYDFSGSYPDRQSVMMRDGTLSLIVPSDRGLLHVTYSIEKEKKVRRHITQVNRDPAYGQSITLQHDSLVESFVLVREERLLVDDLRDDETKETLREVLCRHIQQDSLRWFFQDSHQHVNESWHDHWQKAYLPSMIRVVFKYQLDGEWVDIERLVLLPTSAYVYHTIEDLYRNE